MPRDTTPQLPDTPTTGVPLLDHVLTTSVATDYPRGHTEDAGNHQGRATGWASLPAIALVSAILVFSAATVVRDSGSAANTRERLASRVDSVRADISATAAGNQQLLRENSSLSRALVAQTALGPQLAAAMTASEAKAAGTSLQGMGACVWIGAQGARLPDRLIQMIANAMLRSQPTAMSIANVRMTAKTAIRSAAGQLQVGYTAVAAPLRICALFRDGAAKTSGAAAWRRVSILAARGKVPARHSIGPVSIPAAPIHTLQTRIAVSE